MTIVIEGFLVSRDLIERVKNQRVKLFIPTCILFERDFRYLVELRKKLRNIAPLMTLDEIPLLVPNRLDYIYSLIKSGMKDICIIAPNSKALVRYKQDIELLSKVLNLYIILLSIENVELTKSEFSDIKVKLFLPLSDESVKIVMEHYQKKFGLVFSTRMYIRVKRSVVSIDPGLLLSRIGRIRALKRVVEVIIDILDIGFHRACL